MKSPFLHQVVSDLIRSELPPDSGPLEAWETRLFLALENQLFEDPLFHALTADAKSRLRLAFHIAERYLAFHYRHRRRLSLPESYNPDTRVWSKVDDSLRHARQEWFGFIPVYPNGNLGELVPVFRGTSNRVQIDPLTLFSELLRLKPVGAYFIHNHPSGDLRPSFEDEKLTTELKKACESIGLRFFGHGIVSSVGEAWICDMNLAHGSQPARKSKTRFYSPASSRAR